MSWVQVELQFEVRGLRGSCCLEAQHGINFHSGFFEDSMLWQRALERRSGSYLPKSPVDEQPGVRNGLFPSLSMQFELRRFGYRSQKCGRWGMPPSWLFGLFDKRLASWWIAPARRRAHRGDLFAGLAGRLDASHVGGFEIRVPGDG